MLEQEQIESLTRLIEEVQQEKKNNHDFLINLFNTLKLLQKEIKTLKPKTKPKKTNNSAGLNKEVIISEQLQEFLEVKTTKFPRIDVTRMLIKYIKDNNLQNPLNKKLILLEGSPAADKLNLLLHPTEPLTFINIQRYLKVHLTTDYLGDMSNSLDNLMKNFPLENN